MSGPRRRRGVFGRAASAALGLIIGGARVQAAPDAPAGAAPAAWIAYGRVITASLEAWLNDDSATATRLRRDLLSAGPVGQTSSQTLLLTVWIDPRGAVSRVEPQTPLAPSALEDLNGVVLDRALPSAPPPGLPATRIRVVVTPQPAADPAAPTPRPAQKSGLRGSSQGGSSQGGL